MENFQMMQQNFEASSKQVVQNEKDL